MSIKKGKEMKAGPLFNRWRRRQYEYNKNRIMGAFGILDLSDWQPLPTVVVSISSITGIARVLVIGTIENDLEDLGLELRIKSGQKEVRELR
ncbi:MAG: hypothetical protein WDZ39_00085 [Candidatus Spechtbacterales bacterium]